MATINKKSTTNNRDPKLPFISTESRAEGKLPPLTIKNAKIIWKNFAGTAKKYNAAGLRNFHVVLDLDIANRLLADGWNIKYEEPRNEGDPPMAHMKVNFSFEHFPPRILLISGQNASARSVLTAADVSILDWADIERVDLVLSGSRWQKGSDYGVKTWLRKAIVTLSPDDLESEYMIPIKTASDPDEDDD